MRKWENVIILFLLFVWLDKLNSMYPYCCNEYKHHKVEFERRILRWTSVVRWYLWILPFVLLTSSSLHVNAVRSTRNLIQSKSWSNGVDSSLVYLHLSILLYSNLWSSWCTMREVLLIQVQQLTIELEGLNILRNALRWDINCSNTFHTTYSIVK